MLTSEFSRNRFFLAFCFFTAACYGQQQGAQPQGGQSDQGGQNTKQDDTLKGLGFGVGLGFRWHTGHPDLVSDATIDSNGAVQVNTRNNTTAGLVLEMHHYFLPSNHTNFGVGPFVAVQSGTDQVISAAGGGIMLGWKTDAMNNKAFGLGFGYAGIPSAKVMVHGFVEGQKPTNPLPPGTTTVPLQTRDTGAILIVLSLNFK